MRFIPILQRSNIPLHHSPLVSVPSERGTTPACHQGLRIDLLLSVSNNPVAWKKSFFNFNETVISGSEDNISAAKTSLLFDKNEILSFRCDQSIRGNR